MIVCDVVFCELGVDVFEFWCVYFFEMFDMLLFWLLMRGVFWFYGEDFCGLMR